MSDICEIVITAPDPEWLADFTRRLVEDRLVAGAHLVEKVRSIYFWGGVVHDKSEARVALHTRRSLFAAVSARVEAEHPYEVPCILMLSVTETSAEYEAWVQAETIAHGPLKSKCR